MNWKTASGNALPLAERTYLRDAAATVALQWKKPVIVNIGVLMCASMYCLRAGSVSAQLVCVDIHKPRSKVHSWLKAKFIIADSKVCHKFFKDPIRLLFVDGDHRYAGVKADIAGWVPKVMVGGMVIFHDCYPLPKAISVHPEVEGVLRAVSEWFEGAKGWTELKAPNSLRAFRRNQ